MYIQDLAGVAHDDIDPSVFSIRGDEQKVSSCILYMLQDNYLICLFNYRLRTTYCIMYI